MIRRTLEGAHAFDPGHALEEHGAGGLAAFAADGYFRGFTLLHPARERVVVGRRFHLRPFLAGLEACGRFHLLALSQKHPRLFDATEGSARPVDVAGMPSTIESALQYDEHERVVRSHSVGKGQGGQGPLQFHGQDATPDVHKDELLRFFRRVDKAVHAALHESRLPLVLACVDYFAPIYREANNYPHLVEAHVKGSPDRVPPAQLAAAAWDLVRDGFAKHVADGRARFRALAGTGRTSDDLGQILVAAGRGRVESLFVDAHGSAWGTFDVEHGTLEEHGTALPDDQDLLDVAAALTLAHGGTVHAVEPSAIPAPGRAAAILRF
jgi:hypothetical protein